MKRSVLAVLVLGLCVTQAMAVQGQGLKTQQQKLSYTMGYDSGYNLRQNFNAQSVSLDLNLVLQGLKDGLASQKPKLTQKQMERTRTTFQKEMIAKREAKFKASAKKNAEVGAKFLAANKNKPGVKTLKDGLQYKIIKAGKGPIPSKTDLVTVNYEGKFVNGKVFDSSHEHGGPVTFVANKMLPGWTQALMKMPVGSTWELYIPAKLAYGKYGIGPIGPNETLIFKVDLLAIKNPMDLPKQQ